MQNTSASGNPLIAAVLADNNISKAFRAGVALAVSPQCPHCKVLMSPTHSHAPICPLYVKLKTVAYDATGFVRDAAGRILGLNVREGR